VLVSAGHVATNRFGSNPSILLCSKHTVVDLAQLVACLKATWLQPQLCHAGGLDDGARAAAIAVPVVVVALAGALLLLCCIKRRRRKQQSQPKQQQQLLALVRQDSSSRHGLPDIEAAQPPYGYQDVQHDRDRDQVIIMSGLQCFITETV
jgi:hypothetical protein